MWNSNTLATSCEELTHWKRLWCWEGLREGEEGDDRGWDGWMASLTWWTRDWVNSRSWWWTGRPGVLRLMGSQGVGHNWATELNWTDRLLEDTGCNSLCYIGLLLQLSGKESAWAGDGGLIPGSGRSPGEGYGNPLQHSCLGNPMDRETWQAI